jgi:hypothetical protein
MRLAHQLLEGDVMKIEQLTVKRMRLCVVRNHVHAKADSDADDMESDAAGSDDAKCLAP